MGDIFAGIDGTTPSLTKSQYFQDPFDRRMSFIRSLYQGCAAQNKRWFAGPDLGGFKVPECIAEPLDFIMGCKPSSSDRILIAGYSRGAYAAIRVAQGLGKAGLPVSLLILLDTVKVTTGGVETAIGNVIRKYDPKFQPDAEADSSLRAAEKTAQMPGAYWPVPDAKRFRDASVAASVARYNQASTNEIYHADRSKRAEGSWNLVDQSGNFIVPGNVQIVLDAHRSPEVQSRDWTMGVSPVAVKGGTTVLGQAHFLTHSGMGGMPFRGDLPTAASSRSREWAECGRVARRLVGLKGITFQHPTLNTSSPPDWWLNHAQIQEQYEIYRDQFGTDGLSPKQDAAYAEQKLNAARAARAYYR
jgi:hypothetical protein